MHLSATPDQIWAVLADPALMELRNPKCVRCQAESNLVRVVLCHRATFRPQPSGKRAEVTHDADFAHSDLPWWLKVFMKVLGVFGHQRSRASLDGGADMVERLEQRISVRERTW
jgi:hypothetical protein